MEKRLSAHLPIRYNLTLAYILTFAVTLLMAAASIIGLLSPDLMYPSAELRLSLIPNDALNLALGVPVLLIALWLAQRGRLIGLLMWPGGLFYVLYTYLYYLVGVPVTVLFLPYLLLVALSVCTLIAIIAAVDGPAVRGRLAGAVPARISAGILLALAIIIIARQLGLIFTTLSNAAQITPLERGLWLADSLIAVPALLVVGVSLWQRKPLGYVAGAGLFLQYGVLSVELAAVLAYGARLSGSPLGVADVVVVLVMAVFCFVPFALFVRAAASERQMAMPRHEVSA
jgi:hypothetical protein